MVWDGLGSPGDLPIPFRSAVPHVLPFRPGECAVRLSKPSISHSAPFGKISTCSISHCDFLLIVCNENLGSLVEFIDGFREQSLSVTFIGEGFLHHEHRDFCTNRIELLLTRIFIGCHCWLLLIENEFVLCDLAFLPARPCGPQGQRSRSGSKI